MKKPFFVWVILLMTVWGTVSIARFYLGISQFEGASPELTNAMKQASLFEHALKILRGTLGLVAAVVLFRLKPLALPLYAALLCLSVFQSAAGPFFSPALRMLVEQHGIWPLFAGPALSGLFLWYVWHLKQKGILHAQQGVPADVARPAGARRG
jgi:hypothetical protein